MPKKSSCKFKQLSLPNTSLRAWSDSCEGCPLHESVHLGGTVGTEYHASPGSIDVMFIGEAPGETEDDVGRPLIGKTGSLLRRAIMQTNGTERGVAYGNVVRCRPITQADNKKQNRTPTKVEIKHCLPNIVRDIDKLQPKVIVLLGATAAHSLAKEAAVHQSIKGKARKRVDGEMKLQTMLGSSFVVETEKGTYPAIVTYHPSAVSRNPKCGGIFKGDIAKAFVRANAPAEWNKRGKPTILLDTVKKVQKFLLHLTRDLSKSDVVMLDYETWHPSNKVVRLGMQVLTIGFSYAGDRGYVIPYQHPESPFTGKEFRQVKKMLTEFFSNPDVSFGALGAHNIKYECAVTKDAFGVTLGIAYPIIDTMLRAHQLNENRIKQISEPFSLKTLIDDQLGCTVYHDEDIVGVVALVKQGRAKEVPLSALAEYNAIDCYGANRLYDFQDRLAEMEGYRDKLTALGEQLHGPVSSFASWMEQNGILLDKDEVQSLRSPESPIIGRMAAIEKELYALERVKEANDRLLGLNRRLKGVIDPFRGRQKAPWVFDIGKPACRRVLFFTIMELHYDKENDKLVWTKTTKAHQHKKPHELLPEHLSVDRDLFEEFKGIREVDLIAEWAQLEKIRSTYLESVYKLLRYHPDMRDGRIRGSFHFHTTRSSRASSSDPNMQNIPRGDNPSAKIVKKLYKVEPGNVLVCADYSQAEIRGLAHISEDDKLIGAYVNAYKAERAYRKNPSKENLKRLGLEGDFHRQTASQIFNVPLSAVTKQQRTASKTVVFGIVYGMSAHGLSRRLSISLAEAEKYIEAFLSQFPQAREWLERIEAEGFKDGYVDSPIGRRRHMLSNFILDPKEDSWGEARSHKSYEDRSCRNSPIQSLASDMNFTACIKIHQHAIRQRKSWRVVNVVHDSIMAEIPFNEVEEYVEVANGIMSDRDLLNAFGVRFNVPLKADFTVGITWADQLETSLFKTYKVSCKSCGASRKEDISVANKRCEQCGEKSKKRLSCQLVAGPLPLLLRSLDKRHHLSGDHA